MQKKRFFSLFLTLLLFGTAVLPCFGSSTQEKISNAKDAQQQTQSSLNSTKERIKALEEKKGKTESYLKELDSQLSDLQNKLEELQTQSENKQQELETVQQDLEEAKLAEAKQHEQMKRRIQYSYENTSAGGYLTMLFSAHSFVDFLNRAENISAVAAYDRKMLDAYREIKAEVEQKEAQVLKEQEEIRALQNQSFEQQEQVEELFSETYLQMREYQETIKSAKSEEALLLEKISSQEEAINKLLKQAKDEEAAAARKREEQRRKKEEEERKKREQALANKPKPQKPASPKPPASRPGSSNPGGTYLGRFKLTAYCACPKCCGKWSGGNTASGTRPTPGRTVAMGGVPFGTKLSINGQIYTVEDRGTAYGHVDIFHASHSQAVAFGLRYADVYQIN